jgi:hypothetical protein
MQLGVATIQGLISSDELIGRGARGKAGLGFQAQNSSAPTVTLTRMDEEYDIIVLGMAFFASLCWCEKLR